MYKQQTTLNVFFFKTIYTWRQIKYFKKNLITFVINSNIRINFVFYLNF